jgi:putative peptidoglycan lipid II flippase
MSKAVPNVARAGGIMTASILLSRVLGILRDTVMAAKFGIGLDTDAYRLAFTIPDLLFFLIAGGALSSAFIPVFSKLLHTGKEGAAWELFSVVTTVMSIIVIAVVALVWIFAHPIAAFMAHGKDAQTIDLVVTMSRVVLPAQFAFFIGGLMFGTLYAHHKFIAPGLAPNVYNLGIIFGAIFLSGFFTPGIIGMSWGALFGAILGNFALPLLAMRAIGARFQPSLNIKAEGVKQVFILMLPVILGLSLPGVYGIIMQKFASLYPAGVNTALDLSNKLQLAPLGVFGQSIALAVFPALSQYFAQENMDAFRGQLSRSLRTTIYLGVPAAALIAAMSPQIVTLAYGYGKTSAADLPPTWDCLRLFSIGIAAWCMHPVLFRGFFAVHQSVKPIVIGTLTTVLFLAFYFVFQHAFGSRGYLALPLAGSLAAIVMVVVLLGAIRQDVGDLDYAGFLKTLGGAALGSLGAGGFAFAAFHFLPHHMSRLLGFLAFAVVFCIAGWIYYFITSGLKMPETEYVGRILRRGKPSPAN